MAYEQKELQGVLFPAKEKKSERSPSMQGNILINGVKYRLSAWTKESAKGKFLSLAASVDTQHQPKSEEVGF